MCFCVNSSCEPHVVYIITFQQAARLRRRPGATFPEDVWGSDFSSPQPRLLLESNPWTSGCHSYTGERVENSQKWDKDRLINWCSLTVIRPHPTPPRPQIPRQLDSVRHFQGRGQNPEQGGAANPAGLTNWLLSLLRGINLSDLADSACAMKRYCAHRLNT